MPCSSEYGIQTACCLWLWDCKNSQEPVLHVAPHRQTGRRRNVLQARHDRQIPVGTIQRLPPPAVSGHINPQAFLLTLPSDVFHFRYYVFFFWKLHCFYTLLPIVSKLGVLSLNKSCSGWLGCLHISWLVHGLLMTNIIGKKGGEAGQTGTLSALWVMAQWWEDDVTLAPPSAGWYTDFVPSTIWYRR